MDFSVISVKDILKEIMTNLWNNSLKISLDRKGLLTLCLNIINI